MQCDTLIDIIVQFASEPGAFLLLCLDRFPILCPKPPANRIRVFVQPFSGEYAFRFSTGIGTGFTTFRASGDCFLLRYIGTGTDISCKRTVWVESRDTLIEDPAVLSVMTPESILHSESLPRSGAARGTVGSDSSQILTAR
jgi:hypothetical protein